MISFQQRNCTFIFRQLLVINKQLRIVVASQCKIIDTIGRDGNIAFVNHAGVTTIVRILRFRGSA